MAGLETYPVNPKIKQIIANFETAGIGKFRAAMQDLRDAHRAGEITLHDYMTWCEAISTVGLENPD